MILDFDEEEALKRSLVGRFFNLPPFDLLAHYLNVLTDKATGMTPLGATSKGHRRTMTFLLTDNATLQLQFKHISAHMYECIEHCHERIGEEETVRTIVKRESGKLEVHYETEPKVTHLIFTQGEKSAMPEGCITGKQVGLLQARYREAGFGNDRAFLEWLEFQSGLEIEADCLEQIPASRLDRILKVLASL